MERRDLSFGSLDDLLADIHAFPADGAGLTAVGNWTPAGNVDHVAKAIEYSTHGFPEGRPPFLARMLFTSIIKVTGKVLFRMQLKPGVKLNPAMSYLLPDEGVTWEQAVARLDKAVADAKAKGMHHHSPIAGNLGHERWTLLHCRHGELHFSFIHAGGEADAAADAD